MSPGSAEAMASRSTQPGQPDAEPSPSPLRLSRAWFGPRSPQAAIPKAKTIPKRENRVPRTLLLIPDSPRREDRDPATGKMTMLMILGLCPPTQHAIQAEHPPQIILRNWKTSWHHRSESRIYDNRNETGCVAASSFFADVFRYN